MGNRRIWLLLLTAALLLSLTGCGQLRNARPIEDIHNMDGQRVGVVLGYASDYLLTGREDMTLMRYNTTAALVTALCFQRVDAIALERSVVPMVLNSVEGIRCIEEPLTCDGITALISPDRKDLWEEFNAFIPEFQKTEAFADLLARSQDLKGYVPREVPEADSDRVLRVAVVDDGYPFTYIDMETWEYNGIDVEVIRWFAYTCGYRLELVGGSWTSMEMSTRHRMVDMGVSCVSDLYRMDYEQLGLCYVSDIYIEMDLLLLEVEDPEKLAIVAALE